MAVAASRGSLFQKPLLHPSPSDGELEAVGVPGEGEKFAVIPCQRAKTNAASGGWLPMSLRADLPEAG